MTLFWLSFAVTSKSLGVAIVEAKSLSGAVSEASRRGINPGGEVLGLEVPSACVDAARPYRNRLLTAEEAVRVFGPKSSAEELVDAQEKGYTDVICEECNTKEPPR